MKPSISVLPLLALIPAVVSVNALVLPPSLQLAWPFAKSDERSHQHHQSSPLSRDHPAFQKPKPQIILAPQPQSTKSTTDQSHHHSHSQPSSYSGTIHMQSRSTGLQIPLSFTISGSRCSDSIPSCIITDLADALVTDLPLGFSLPAMTPPSLRAVPLSGQHATLEPLTIVEDITSRSGGRTYHSTIEVALQLLSVGGSKQYTPEEWLVLVGLLRSGALEVGKEVDFVESEGRAEEEVGMGMGTALRDVVVEGVVEGVWVRAEWRFGVVDEVSGRIVSCLM